MKALPPAEYLRECFSYDPETGELRWKERPASHFPNSRGAWVHRGRYAGKCAGTIEHGYRWVLLGKVKYCAHRLIWKLMTGQDPADTIDHIDGDRDNNRRANLREATQREQTWNSGVRRTNSAGMRGVVPHSGKWQASIQAKGVSRHLGTFASAEEASVAYNAAARELYGEFYRPA